MWQTLIYIPEKLGGIPLFGFGLLFVIWAIASLIVMILQVRRAGWNADAAGTLVTLAVLGALVCFVLPNVMVEIPGTRAADGGPAYGLPIRGYGTMLLLAVAAALSLAMHRAKRRGLDPNVVINLAFWIILPGIVGARLFHVIEYWPIHYGPVLRQQGLPAALAAVINISAGGLVVYGSLIGGLIGGVAFILRYGFPFWATLDLISPSLALGLAIGRLGCFLNGCCFGGACDLPWAVRFPPASPAYEHQLEHGDLYIAGVKLGTDPDAPQGPPVIRSVLPGSAAEKSGVRPGMHLLAVNGRAIASVNAAAEPRVLAPGCACCSQAGKAESSSDAKRAGVRLLLQAVTDAARDGLPVRLTLRTQDGQTLRWSDASPLPARGEPLHPTQLYSSLNAIILLFVLLAFEPFQKRDGELFTLLMGLYPISRFAIEIIRNDEPGAYCGLTISQVVSLAILILAAASWLYLKRFGRPKGRPAVQ
ncbi:prolipoprotein diacylglyceryl transferase family protein [Thermopirellula anaerolimosa]